MVDFEAGFSTKYFAGSANVQDLLDDHPGVVLWVDALHPGEQNPVQLQVLAPNSLGGFYLGILRQKIINTTIGILKVHYNKARYFHVTFSPFQFSIHKVNFQGYLSEKF